MHFKDLIDFIQQLTNWAQTAGKKESEQVNKIRDFYRQKGAGKAGWFLRGHRPSGDGKACQAGGVPVLLSDPCLAV